MQQLHIYKRQYQNNYQDHIQTLESMVYLDGPIFEYITQNWEENRVNALYEYEVQVHKDEYDGFIQVDDTHAFDFLKQLQDDEDCYLSIY